MSFLGVHIGVTRCTAAVYGVDGTLLCRASEEYPIVQTESGGMELDADQVMALVRTAIRKVCAGNHERNDTIRALSFAVQGEAIVPVSAQGEAVGPILTTFDQRAQIGLTELCQHIDRVQLYHTTGLPAQAIYSLPKILWLRKHRPEIFQRTAQFLDIGSLFLLHLGLVPAIDPSLAGRTLLLDLARQQWSQEILTATGLSTELFPPIVPTGTLLGVVASDIAHGFGLPPGVSVILGGHDQACAALGSGVIDAGVAMDATSATESLAVVSREPVVNTRMLAGHYDCYPHVVPERYLTLAYNNSAGSLLRWFRETLGFIEDTEARVTGISFEEILLKKAQYGPSRVCIVPHFAGTGTPWMDESARGLIYGLTLRTSRAEIIKALFDGLAYEMRENIDWLAHAGVPINRIQVIGRDACSPIWLALKANIYRNPVNGNAIKDAVTLGAALLAGIGVGGYRDVRQATSVIQLNCHYAEPISEEVAAYDRQYQYYRTLSLALRQFEQQVTA